MFLGYFRATLYMPWWESSGSSWTPWGRLTSRRWRRKGPHTRRGRLGCRGRGGHRHCPQSPHATSHTPTDTQLWWGGWCIKDEESDKRDNRGSCSDKCQWWIWKNKTGCLKYLHAPWNIYLDLNQASLFNKRTWKCHSPPPLPVLICVWQQENPLPKLNRHAQSACLNPVKSCPHVPNPRLDSSCFSKIK